MKRKPLWKRIVLPIAIVLSVGLVGGGIWYALSHRKTEPVYVYPFSMIGMTEYWGDSRESYGPVLADHVQTVYLSDTQTVTEVFVSAGDTVKKGDPLLSYDTTLSDLALERKRLDVERLKLRLEDAEEYLKEIKRMKPMVIPETTPVPDEDDTQELGVLLTEPYRISTDPEYDGSTPERSLILWLRSDAELDHAAMNALFETAETFQTANASPSPAPSDAPETEPPAEQPPLTSLYVVIKVSEGNRSLGMRLTWQGMLLLKEEENFSFRFFDAADVTDHTIVASDAPDQDQPEIDFGSGFTSAQLKEMRAEQEKVIRDLEFQIKLEEANYQIMLAERNDGMVYAEIDGTVLTVLSAEEAILSQQPMLKLSAGGGFAISCSVSELERDTLVIGQEVTVNDWNSGMTYVGTISEISDFPLSGDQFMGYGNPFVSYYPFTVFVDESADLMEGSYVSVQYSAGETKSGIYLERPYVRTENGKSYVFVADENGLIEKRFVSTGISLWGSYVEITEGLTAEDLIAFPYGKHLKVGAPTLEGDYETMYEQ